MEIRRVLPHEYQAAADVAVEAYAAVYGDLLGYYAGHLRDVAARDVDAEVLVAVAGERIVGTATYVPDESSPFAELLRTGEAGIRMLAVAPGFARRGVGRALSQACIDRARRAGMQAVALHADELMMPARSLYEAMGFRRDPERDYRPDEQTLLLGYVLDL